MFRKIVSLFSICALALALCACSGKGDVKMEKPSGKLGGEAGSNVKVEDSVQGLVSED
ncbi:MAG TPA: hypothetical protein PKD54_14665 [Pirellulaceae bacterium]|nr:hypothetical protein [Pirellulaceae bacterium]